MTLHTLNNSTHFSDFAVPLDLRVKFRECLSTNTEQQYDGVRTLPYKEGSTIMTHTPSVILMYL